MGSGHACSSVWVREREPGPGPAQDGRRPGRLELRGRSKLAISCTVKATAAWMQDRVCGSNPRRQALPETQAPGHWG